MGQAQAFPIISVSHQIQALLVSCANKSNSQYRKSSEDDNEGKFYQQQYQQINSTEYNDEMNSYSFDVLGMSSFLSKWYSCKQFLFCQQDHPQKTQKQLIMDQITSCINDNHYLTTLIYLSGNGKEQTGDLILEYNNDKEGEIQQNEFITFFEIYNIWKTRKSKQKMLLIILESSYSGGWIKQLDTYLREKQSVDYSIAIYASSQFNQLAYETSQSKGGLFTQNLLTTLSNNKKNAEYLIDQYEEKLLQNPQFYGMQFKLYEMFGMPFFFTTIYQQKQFILKEGWIKQTYLTGELYDGFINSSKQRDGLGIFTYQNQTKYIGEFKQGKFNGRGIMQYSEFSYYEGEWESDQKHGLGTEYYQTGDFYEGDWKFGKKNGFGVYQFMNGDIYEGQFKNDQFCGTGTIIYKSGAKYIGQWLDDKKHGKGTFFYNDGSIYEGEFLNGQSNGFGIETYKSGNRYEGQFKSDNKHGNGIYYYKNGDREEGEWEDNKQIGKQILYTKNGQEEKFY